MRVNQRIKNAFFTLLGAGAGTQLMLLVFAPLLTRLYLPEDFGAYGLAIAICASLAAVSGGRLEFAIPTSGTENQAAQLFVLTVLLASISLGCVGLLGIASTYLYPDNPIASLVGGNIAAWIALGAFAITVTQATTFWLMWHKNYEVLARVRWLQCFGQSVSQGLGGALGLDGLGLLVGHTIGQLTGVACAFILASSYPFRHAIRQVLPHFRRLVVQYKNYPMTLGPATVANLLVQHMPVVLIGAIYGLSSAGIYAIAQRVCGGPLVLIGQAVGQLYIAEMPRFMEVAPLDVYSNYTKLVRVLLGLALLIFIFLVSLAPHGAVFLFGGQWVQLGSLIQILAACFVLEFAATPVSMTLNFIGYRGQQLRWDVSRLAGVLGVFLIGFYYELEFQQTMIILAAVLSISYVCLFVVMAHSLRSWGKRKSTSALRDCD
jgi:O-antigen/teichoic acid export membrane protein